MGLRVCEVTFHEDAAPYSGGNTEEFVAMGARESLVEKTEKTSWIVIRNDSAVRGNFAIHGNFAICRLGT